MREIEIGFKSKVNEKRGENTFEEVLRSSQLIERERRAAGWHRREDERDGMAQTRHQIVPGPEAAPEHPGLTREMLSAVVLLLIANVSTFCSGLALIVYGTRSGQKAQLLNKIFEGSDYEATVFDDPARAATVLGSLLLITSIYGLCGVYTRNKLMLILYHGWTFFAFIGFVYAICVFGIYRTNAPAMVESYFNGEEVNIDEAVTREGDEIEYFNISTIEQIDDAKNVTTTDALQWIDKVDSSARVSMVFILIAMFSASFIMGVRYTARRMGGFANVAGWIFGIVLAVLAFTVAKSTYKVSDAIAVDLNTVFVHEYGVDPWRAITLKETLDQYPEDIFLPPVLYDSPPPYPLAPGEIAPPSPDAGPPAPVGIWYADGVWVEYANLRKISEIRHDVSCRLALTGVNHTEGRVSTDFVDWIKFQIADYAAVETTDVEFLQTKEGAEHPIAGKKAARTLGGAAIFVVIASAAGMYGTLKHDRRLLALHLLISIPCGIFIVITAHAASQGADDTFESMRLHWHALQHAYIGPAVTTGSAAAFASAHFKQAAALGAIVASVIWLSIFSSIGMIITHDSTRVGTANRQQPGSDIENQRLAQGPTSSSSSPLDSSKLGGGGTGKVAENIVEMKSLAATVRDAATGRGQFKPGFRPTELKDAKKASSSATQAKGGRPKPFDKDLDAKFSVD